MNISLERLQPRQFLHVIHWILFLDGLFNILAFALVPSPSIRGVQMLVVDFHGSL